MAKILFTGRRSLFRFSFSRLLKNRGHNVIKAGQGEAAIKAYQTHKPDLALVTDDIMVVEKILSGDKTAKVIALVSTTEQARRANELLKVELKAFFYRPIDRPDSLQAAIESALVI